MKVARTKIFDRNFRKLAKKNYPVDLVTDCVTAVINKDKETLIKIHDHALRGKWKGKRAFHPARLGDKGRKQYDGWVVIYEIRKKELILVLVDTDDHSRY